MALHQHPIGRALVSALVLTIGVGAALTSTALLARSAGAQFGLDKTLEGIGDNKPSTYTKDAGLPVIIGNVIQVALSLVGTIFLVLMIYGGFLWMTARGDQKNVQKAKDLISSAIIGLIIVASAYAITSFVLTRVEGGGSGGGSESSPGPVNSP